MLKATNKKIKYQSTGLVYGNYWGGGEGAYKALTLKANTIDELLKEAENRVENGSLDSGMGYESLIGAMLDVATITTVEIEGEIFENIKYEIHTVGNFTDKQFEFLENIILEG